MNSEKIKRKTLKQKSFLLSSSSNSARNSRSSCAGSTESSQKKISSLLQAIDNLHVLQPKRSINDQNSLKKYSPVASLSSHTPFSSPQLITDQEFQNDDHQDFILKRTVSIETNLPLPPLLLQQYISHQLIQNFEMDSKYLQLFNQSKLWKFPSGSQTNQFSSPLHPPETSLSSHSRPQHHILDAIWRISKNGPPPKYQLLLQEHLLLWQEAFFSACQLFFNETVSEIYFIGTSTATSSFRVILSRNSSSSTGKRRGSSEALISSCPRSLYLKMIEAGLEVFTLLDRGIGAGGDEVEVSNSKISLPISHLSDKILHLKGDLSLRLFVDLFLSHSLSLHSIASYHRVIENLPTILTTQYFLHSSLQLNSLDAFSSSEPNHSLASPSPSPTAAPEVGGTLEAGARIGIAPESPVDQKSKPINRYQLTGFFSHSSIKLLCFLLKNVATLENQNHPCTKSPLLRVMIDPRVLRRKALANDPSGGAAGNRLLFLDDDSGVVLDQKLLNPFQITKSNPTDTSLPLQLNTLSSSPRIRRSRSSNGNGITRQVEEPSSSSPTTLVSPLKSYFNLKFFSLQADYVFNYLQSPPLSNGSSAGERGGQIFSEIRWKDEEHSYFEIDAWTLSPCRDEPVDYEVSRRNEEVVVAN
jgi:hypothetical protein